MPGRRYAGMDIGAKVQQDALYRQYRKLLQDMQVTGLVEPARGGGMGSRFARSGLRRQSGCGAGLAKALRRAWRQAPTAIDLRDRQASRYSPRSMAGGRRRRVESPYKGGFEGIDEKTAGLDELFGKPGTWDTLISEQTKAAQKQTKELADALAKVMKGPIPVTIVGAWGRWWRR